MTYRQMRLNDRQNAWLAKVYLGPEEDDWGDYDQAEYDAEAKDFCHYCGGDGFGIVGTDWDSDDPINGPYNGEVEVCPCCGGTGDAKDCTFW